MPLRYDVPFQKCKQQALAGKQPERHILIWLKVMPEVTLPVVMHAGLEG